jgi:hypothetical protein
MSNLSDFIGSEQPTTSIINAWSPGGVAGMANLHSTQNPIIFTTAASGALTANTYKLMLDISGAGTLAECRAYTASANAQTLGLKVTIDGVDVFDEVTASIAATNTGLVATSGASGITARFKTSLKVYIKSSLAASDEVTLAYAYTLT